MVRIRILAFALLLFMACQERRQQADRPYSSRTADSSKPQEPATTFRAPCDQKPEKRKHSDRTLLRFLDSIGGLTPSSLAREASAYVDSVYRSFPPVRRTLSAGEYQLLQKSIEQRSIDPETARKLFGQDYALDDYSGARQIPIRFFLFDDRHREQDYAVILGDGSRGWKSFFYFFHGKTLLAKHDVFHHNEIELHSFRNEQGETVVYYKYVYNWGSGISHFQYFFYCYHGDRLVPCLNLLRESNQANYVSPFLGFSSAVRTTLPLTVHMDYSWSILSSAHYTDPCDSAGTTYPIISDSCTVRFRWDTATGTYAASYPRRDFGALDLPTYYQRGASCSPSLLFVRLHYPLFQRLLRDTNTRSSMLYFLDQCKAGCTQAP